MGSQSEGCVADDELGFLYIAEENVGIWKYGAEPDSGAARLMVDRVWPQENPEAPAEEVRGRNLVADVEGLAIAYGDNGTGYLIASSQGDSKFAIYRREGDNSFVKVFRIVAGGGVDAVEETDGIEVTTAGLGPAFPRGLFVAHDGINKNGNQNFKLVP